jgi:tetratricopeptide (TPR) repeat protein
MLNKIMILIRIVAIMGALFAVHRLTIQPWRCNLILKQVQLSSLAAMSSTSPQDAARSSQRNLDRLEAHEAGCRMKVDYYLMLAANNLFLGRYEPAVATYQRALTIDHRPEIYFDLGTTLLEQGRVAEATPLLIQAVRFNPMMLDQISGEARKRVAVGAGLE